MEFSAKLFISGALVGLLSMSAGYADILDEISVTAQKREQSSQDVAISMTAFSGTQIKQLGIDSTVDLSAYVPGLTIGQNTGDGDFPFISLRGVTVRDFSDLNESPSTVYINEFYKANLVGLDQQVYDMQRVEVLRGPQGTLYGRNATGGLIHYITEKPTSEPSAYVDVTFGEYNKRKLEGAIGGPLGETVSGRLSVLHHAYDGWVKNVFPGGVDGSALDVISGRGQLLFEPSDDLSFSLFVQHSQNNNNAGNMFTHRAARVDPVTGLALPAPGQDGYNPLFFIPGSIGYIEATPGDNRDTNSDRDIYLDTEQTTAIATVNWTNGDIEFVSITGVESSSKDASFDSDSTDLATGRGTEVHPDSDQFSQELRIAKASDKLSWVAGLYYIDYDIDGYQARCNTRAGGCPVLAPDILYSLETESWAVFGNLDYQFSDELGLTLGLRYSQEDKVYDLNNLDTGLVFNTTLQGDAAREDDGTTSFNVRLNWTPSDDALIYGGVSRGHKAGTFNLGYTARASNIPGLPVDGEQLTSYEVGFKSTLNDSSVRLNGAVFYYDYEDSQAFQFDGVTLTAQAFNNDAEITGAELELAATPSDNLDLFVTATYLDATLKGVEFPGPSFAGLPPVDTDMPLAPELKLSALLRYQWELAGGSRLALQGDVTWYDEQYFDAFNSPSHFEDAYSVANARLSWYSADEKWNAGIFVENLADTEYRTFSFDLAFLGFSTDVYGKPRWAGITVGYAWE